MMSIALDKPFFSFTGLQADAFTIRDCFTGFQIFGGTGSGKTSGSGKYLALRFLKAGFGGLVMTVKPDECSEWQEWAAQTGREDDLIIIKPSNPYRFDFLNYEQNREGEGAGSTFNIVDLLITACDIAKPKVSEGGGGGDKFWEEAANELIAKSVDLLLLAGEDITISNILSLINNAPTGNSKVKLDNGTVIPEALAPTRDAEGKLTYSEFAQIFMSANKKSKSFTKHKRRDFRACHDYFLKDYATLNDRTRSGIKIHVTTTLYQLLRGEMGQLFCNGKPDDDEIEIYPEIAYTHRKIIILDMPVMEWKTTGKLAQGLFKYMFQRAIERRSMKQHPNPVFIWADEAQYFINKADQLFLTTARSSGCATVYLTQNIENYYSIMEEPVARSMLGNLQNKIFHQNSDISTNEYASSIIGKYWAEIENKNTSYSGVDIDNINLSSGHSEQLIYKIQPEQYNYLKTGGLHNNLIVGAVVFSGGRRWVRSEDTYDLVDFKQG